MQSQNDYLREWIHHRDRYLLEVVKLESPPPHSNCSSCSSNFAPYRCVDCWGDLILCSDCCKLTHQQHPFHRIKRWNGSFFESDDLISLGIVLHMGHGGSQCPSYGIPVTSEMPEAQWEDIEDAMMDDDVGEEEGHSVENSFSTIGSHPGVGTGNGQRLWGPFVPETTRMVIVTSNGVYRHQIGWCHCPGGPDNHIQLLQLRLLSASINRPSTAFTFELLDHFHIDAMECKTAALNFFANLRRTTNGAFPASVPVSPLFD